MRWSVSLVAEGDRVIELDEVVELADAVAASNGIASGMGTMSYGAQVVVEADDGEQAVERAIAMSHDKYCSATIMLANTAESTTSFELHEA